MESFSATNNLHNSTGQWATTVHEAINLGIVVPVAVIDIADTLRILFRTTGRRIEGTTAEDHLHIKDQAIITLVDKLETTNRCTISKLFKYTSNNIPALVTGIVVDQATGVKTVDVGVTRSSAIRDGTSVDGVIGTHDVHQWISAHKDRHLISSRTTVIIGYGYDISCGDKWTNRLSSTAT